MKKSAKLSGVRDALQGKRLVGFRPITRPRKDVPQSLKLSEAKIGAPKT